MGKKGSDSVDDRRRAGVLEENSGESLRKNNCAIVYTAIINADDLAKPL